MKPKSQNMTVKYNVDTEIMDYRSSIANKVQKLHYSRVKLITPNILRFFVRLCLEIKIL